jgi:hypothetical protein
LHIFIILTAYFLHIPMISTAYFLHIFMIFTAYYTAYFDTFKCIQIRALVITFRRLDESVRNDSSNSSSITLCDFKAAINRKAILIVFESGAYRTFSVFYLFCMFWTVSVQYSLSEGCYIEPSEMRTRLRTNVRVLSPENFLSGRTCSGVVAKR